MIHKVYPSLNDFENLSRLKVESSDYANDYDYSNIVVNKPWGYEYLWFQNEIVAIWFLYIKKDFETSLHCHERKRTSLIVLDGEAVCTTLDDKYWMKKLDSVVLESCVFHSSRSVSDGGAFIMEIETPPMKGDLVRMNDAYGRQNTGYEKTKEYSDNFDAYEFFPFLDKHYTGWEFRNMQIKLSKNRPMCDDWTVMIVPISGLIKQDNQVVIESGEAKPVDASHLNINDDSYQFLIFNKLN
ncbi:hypothetical protein [Mucilaginibacter sp.]|uniref:cupin domain-containing protein n=1 Tax=Mucilaginibacter sp. TaxID=1882438 RepID=UPI00261CD76A|nr:hypothetical protein [Mucilaginibacter sp.]MDB4926305.1 hypothetical protein [Mucilaginibacter sp.]